MRDVRISFAGDDGAERPIDDDDATRREAAAALASLPADIELTGSFSWTPMGLLYRILWFARAGGPIPPG